MIQIEFNQEKIELPQECSVADFIKDNPNKQNVVGVLINGESKDLSATIQNKDKIILLILKVRRGSICSGILRLMF